MKERIFILIILLVAGFWPLFSLECRDVDENGSVNIVDALVVTQNYVGIPINSKINRAAADVNNDARLDIVDALLIAQFYVGTVGLLDGCKLDADTPEPTEVVIPPSGGGPEGLVGWAAVSLEGLKTTTGGGDLEPVIAKSMADLRRLVSGDTPRTISMKIPGNIRTKAVRGRLFLSQLLMLISWIRQKMCL